MKSVISPDQKAFQQLAPQLKFFQDPNISLEEVIRRSQAFSQSWRQLTQELHSKQTA